MGSLARGSDQHVEELLNEGLLNVVLRGTLPFFFFLSKYSFIFDFLLLLLFKRTNRMNSIILTCRRIPTVR